MPLPLTKILLFVRFSAKFKYILGKFSSKLSRFKSWMRATRLAAFWSWAIFCSVFLPPFPFSTLKHWVKDFRNNQEYYNEISTGDGFSCSAFLHPSTYLNKILLGSREGTMQLWNFKSMYLLA